MIDLKKLESNVGTGTAALIEDSEYSKIQNDDKIGNYPSPYIFDAARKTVNDIISSLQFICDFSGLTTFKKGAMRGSKSDKEMADKVDNSKYYIIIRNVDMMSPNHGSWSDLIDIIKSISCNQIIQFPKSCMIVITKSDIANTIIELDAYCTQCIQ